MGAVRRTSRGFLAGLDAERGALGIGMVAPCQLGDGVRQRLGLFDGRPAVLAPRRQLRRDRGEQRRRVPADHGGRRQRQIVSTIGPLAVFDAIASVAAAGARASSTRLIDGPRLTTVARHLGGNNQPHGIRPGPGVGDQRGGQVHDLEGRALGQLQRQHRVQLLDALQRPGVLQHHVRGPPRGLRRGEVDELVQHLRLGAALGHQAQRPVFDADDRLDRQRRRQHRLAGRNAPAPTQRLELGHVEPQAVAIQHVIGDGDALVQTPALGGLLGGRDRRGPHPGTHRRRIHHVHVVQHRGRRHGIRPRRRQPLAQVQRHHAGIRATLQRPRIRRAQRQRPDRRRGLLPVDFIQPQRHHGDAMPLGDVRRHARRLVHHDLHPATPSGAVAHAATGLTGFVGLAGRPASPLPRGGHRSISSSKSSALKAPRYQPSSPSGRILALSSTHAVFRRPLNIV